MNNKPEYISENEAIALSDSIKLIIMTVTEIEKEAVFNYLKPLPECKSLKEATVKSQTYTIGVFGEYPVVHVQTNMGSTGPDASTLTTMDVLNFWKPKAIIMIGIAFGKDLNKQNIGDVLISESIVEYDNSKIKNGTEIPRGSIVRSGLTLFNRFRNCGTWNFELDDNAKAKKLVGRVLSGSKLIDDKEFKNHLLKNFPEAIGGEMEGGGVYAASFHENFNEWILVKGICDWAENKADNKEKNQLIASRSAASLCHEVLSNPYTFEDLKIKSVKNINLNEIDKTSLVNNGSGVNVSYTNGNGNFSGNFNNSKITQNNYFAEYKSINEENDIFKKKH